MLILDEPTAVLTPAETEELFRIVRQLRDGGTSIIFISHKLKEVQAIADTITVLRRGKVVGERTPPATEADLASLMVGRDVQLRVSKEPAHSRARRYSASSDLTVAGEHGRPAGATGCPSRCGPARSSGSPASRATGRPSCARR